MAHNFLIQIEREKTYLDQKFEWANNIQPEKLDQ
jgi:hypothetical protein